MCEESFKQLDEQLCGTLEMVGNHYSERKRLFIIGIHCNDARQSGVKLKN